MSYRKQWRILIRRPDLAEVSRGPEFDPPLSVQETKRQSSSTVQDNNSRAETECDGTRKRTGGEVKGKKANGGGSQESCTVSDTVYPALLPLMRTPRLPAVD